MEITTFKRDPSLWSLSKKERSLLKKEKRRYSDYKFNNSSISNPPITVYDLKLHLGNKTITVECNNHNINSIINRYRSKCKNEKIKFSTKDLYYKRPYKSSIL